MKNKFLAKLLTEKKTSNEQFNLCEGKRSLDQFIKSINSQTNIKSPCSFGLTAKFYKYFYNKLATFLLDIYDFWGKLGTMLLLLEYELNLSNVNSVIKKILQTTDQCTPIFKNELQKTLGTILIKTRQLVIKKQNNFTQSFYYS